MEIGLDCLPRDGGEVMRRFDRGCAAYFISKDLDARFGKAEAMPLLQAKSKCRSFAALRTTSKEGSAPRGSE